MTDRLRKITYSPTVTSTGSSRKKFIVPWNHSLTEYEHSPNKKRGKKGKKKPKKKQSPDKHTERGTLLKKNLKVDNMFSQSMSNLKLKVNFMG